MASTRLTTNIKNQIINKGFELFSERIRKKENTLRPDFYDDLAQAFMDEFMTPYIRNRSFPDDWMRECKLISVGFSTGWVVNKPLTKTYTIINLNSETTLTIPKSKIDPTLHSEYKQYYESVAVLKQEQLTFKWELERVLNNCNTLTQFLKIWPQGEQLIKNLDLQTASRTRKKKEIEVDQSTLDKLNVGLLKQTMLNN